MATVVTSIGLQGLEGYKVSVEVQIIPGKDSVSIVGLPDACVKESKDRVLAALYSINCQFPEKKIVINLSPTEQKKNSPLFDVAMAVGLMKEMNYFQDKIPPNSAFLGVLSLNGEIRAVRGMLPAILAAKKHHIKILYLLYIEDLPFSEIEGIELRFVHSIQEVIQSFSGQVIASLPSSSKSPQIPINSTAKSNISEKNFKHIIGHKQAKRALEIAVAGAHNVLQFGRFDVATTLYVRE
ncbi:magnesium chelatase domain-containing protein [Fredinandcohnia sp. 179-A 10B2 NHS]|uniref:magnesium chelatase domain-containing protein n=1 Tax=Fredinandcohnia sp. 179-A 10B2 NHS TaxID=3235176 RepID=UPI0039A0BB74